MKKFLFGCAIAVSGLSLSQASAQDFCCPTQCDPCCDSDFNGLYFGGNIGAFTHTTYRNDLDGFLTDNSGWAFNRTRFEGGLQLGYDWQCCNTVIGVVGDWNWVNTRHHILDDPGATATDDGVRIRNRWFSTIRARAGVAVCDALVYVTGGAAVTRFQNRWSSDGDVFNFRETRWGWTGGVGTEFMLGCNWSLGLEVLFLHFDARTRTFDVDGATFNVSHSDSAWLGRVLLNYRFGDLCSCFF